MSHPIRSQFAKAIVVLTGCGLGGPLSAQSITVVSWSDSRVGAVCVARQGRTWSSHSLPTAKWS